MGRVERSWSGDGLLEGRVVPGSGDPTEAARPEPEPQQPKKPGAFRLMWRHHGPFISPFLWLVALWADASAAHRAVPAARLLLTAGPVAVMYFRLRRKTPRKGTQLPEPERAVLRNTATSWLAGSVWLLVAGILTGPSPLAVAVLLLGGVVLAGAHAHEAAGQRRTTVPPAPEPERTPLVHEDSGEDHGSTRQPALDEDRVHPARSRRP